MPPTAACPAFRVPSTATRSTARKATGAAGCAARTAWSRRRTDRPWTAHLLVRNIIKNVLEYVAHQEVRGPELFYDANTYHALLRASRHPRDDEHARSRRSRDGGAPRSLHRPRGLAWRGADGFGRLGRRARDRSEEHTSEL